MKKMKQMLAIAMVVMTAVVFTPMVPSVGSIAFADDGQQAVQTQQAEHSDINAEETEELATQGTGVVIAVTVVIGCVLTGINALVNFFTYPSDLQTVTTGNYVVDKNTTIDHGFLIDGDVILAIKDGCTLTINNTTANDPGICVLKDSNLTITGACLPGEEYKGTGKLIVKGSGSGAGIGGTSNSHYDKDCGSITIEGANIEATAGQYHPNSAYGSAGIGGGCGGAGMDITINGGNVKAVGGTKGAGIGSGDDGGRGDRGGKDIVINGGTVYAEGGKYAAGIGGGYGSDGDDITINGGTVTAKAGMCAAGIGGGKSHTGNNSNGYDISINGGTVYAYGGVKEDSDNLSGAAIGSGYNRAGYDIILNGGNINCYPGDGSPGVGGGRNGETHDITLNNANLWVKGYAAIGSVGYNNPKTKDIDINGGSVKMHVTKTDDYPAHATCVGAVNGDAENIKITNGNLSMESEYSDPKSTLVGAGYNGRKSKNIKVSTSLTIYKDYRTGEKMSNGGGDLGTSFRRQSYARIVNEGSVSFKTASGSMKTVNATKVPNNYADVETASEGDSISTQANETIELSDKVSNGYYYVDGDTLVENSLRCDGNIKLILKDGSKLTANGCKNKAGIEVGKNDRLTIYGGEDGDGAIEATGGSKAAGIGSDYKKACGKINIIGGIITAKAGAKASAIGTGYKGKSGSVRVNTILKLLAKKGKWSTIKNKGGNLIKLLKSRGYVEIKTVNEN